ncbi:hypothetical protein Hanom_Chr06g00542101 [Helianthus anomalus]
MSSRRLLSLSISRYFLICKTPTAAIRHCRRCVWVIISVSFLRHSLSLLVSEVYVAGGGGVGCRHASPPPDGGGGGGRPLHRLKEGVGC